MSTRTSALALCLALVASLSVACGPDDGGGARGGSGSPAGSQAGSSGSAGGPQGGAGSSQGPASAARFFLPTGEPDNTAAPTVEIDSQGNTHAVYPAYAGGGAYYAFCGAGCASLEQTKVVRFPTQGTVANSMIALTAEGHPRVLLSAFAKVYYASCDAGCDTEAGWKLTELLDHAGEREVSGEALALDPQGRPRFLMHTYRAYLGVGQKKGETYLVGCDGADCHDPSSWTQSLIADQLWQGSHLRYDAQGRAKVATVATVEADGSKTDTAAYLECESNCQSADAWQGIGFGPVFQSEYEAVSMKPTVAMALTQSGAPRVAYLGKDDQGKRRLLYMSCDHGCSGDSWKGVVLSDHNQIDAGLDLAVDKQDRPRVVYTLGYNIGLIYCDSADCVGDDAKWDLVKVEAGSDMPPDQIFLYPNCTVGAWFLHSPSVAIAASGEARVGYQARDISGGYKTPDPTKPACVAGTDMTWSRLAVGVTVP